MKIQIISPGVYTYGSMVLGGILRDRGHSVDISKDLRRDGDVIILSLFSTLQLLDPSIREFVSKAESPVYCGGPVGICPEMVLGELDVDAVAMGEGESIIAMLVENGPEGIPGVAYRKDGKIIRSEPSGVDVIDHAMPLFPSDLPAQSVRGANVYIETHRGCLGGCTFCQVPRFFGRNIRSRSLENIVAEVRELKRMGVKRVAVSGGTASLFGYRNSLNKDAFISMLRELSVILGKRNLSVPDMRVDLVDDEILEAIRECTIGWLFFGFESGSDRMLKLMRKGVTVRDNMRAVELARSHGVKVGGSFIVGYPGESREDFEQTLDFMEEAMLDDVFVSIAEPIPGTPLARVALDTPSEDNPLFCEHSGAFRALKISEAEARCFEMMLHGESCKPVPRAISEALYSTYLNEARSQGEDIRKVYGLLNKYSEFV
ncbi:MAG: TIGR04014 family B12-binding domain/radical SAM domain-containing protein [Methanothrix sp.]|uniref:methyl-coenzyme M reductase glutamine C-methyltransferase n=1 Tax=Methanothrix sp. TaxID=90426 RepID=UPI0025E10BCF|nr:methyl-coenzyme M reductase glutamine C-methyltransferase [Methanothrix sp.]MCQ8903003.1 TIGR04014 family B12-binding domain/radical SAM domain-containing protein [Methanothrix sp.]